MFRLWIVLLTFTVSVMMSVTMMGYADFLRVTEEVDTTTTVPTGTTMYHKSYCPWTYYYVFEAVSWSPAWATAIDLSLYDDGDTTLAPSSVDYEPYSDIYRSFYLPSDTRFPPQIINQSLPGDYSNLPPGQDFLSLGAARGTAAWANIHFGTYRFAGVTFHNLIGIQNSVLRLWTDTDPIQLNKAHSTSLATSAGSSLGAGYTYEINIDYIPEPCVPDTQWPSVRDQSLTDLTYHAPAKNTDSAIGSRTTSIMSDFRIDIVEPLGSSHEYHWTTAPWWSATAVAGDVSSYVPWTGTNQRWVDPTSVVFALRYIPAPYNVIDQSSYTSYQTILLSGSDLIFDPLVWVDHTRNNNQGWYRVSLSTAARQALRDAGMDFRKESTVDFGRYAQDYADAMPDTVQRDYHERLWPNALVGADEYTFLNNGADPFITIYRDQARTQDYSNSQLGMYGPVTRATDPDRQIMQTHTGIAFVLGDERAWVNPWSIRVTAQVLQSQQRLHQTYRSTMTPAWWTSDLSFVYSGSDLNLTDIAGIADAPDQAWFLDFDRLRAAIETWSRVILSREATDYVGKILPQTILTLDAPDRPPAPPELSYHLGDYENGDIIPLQSLTGWFASYPWFSGLTLSGPWWTKVGLLSDTIWPNTITNLLLDNDVSWGWYIGTVQWSTLFRFDLIAHNIYGITTPFTLTVRISPTCGDAEGDCARATWMYTGDTLAWAHNRFVSGSGTWFKKNWFALVLWSDTKPLLYQDPVYPDAVVLQCFSWSANKELTIRPYDTLSLSPTVTVTGSTAFTGHRYYLSGEVLYIIRPLSGMIHYFPPEFDTLWHINWTQWPVTWFVSLATGTQLVPHPFVSSTGTFDTMHNTGFDLTLTNLIGETMPLPLSIYWIDRVPPAVTMTTTLLGTWSRLVSFVGSNTGDMAYTSDDEWEFVTWSGVWLTPPFATGLSLLHDVVFTSSWSGSVLIQDKAGNQTWLMLDVSAGDGSTVPLTIKSRAEQRSSSDFVLSGTLVQYERVLSSWSPVLTIDLVLDTVGEQRINVPVISWDVLWTWEWEAHLRQALSWDFLDFVSSGIVDFTTLQTQPDHTVVAGINYATAWDIEKQSSRHFINALDVHLMNINAWSSDLRFDLNANGFVNATDMAILINNLNRWWWWW